MSNLQTKALLEELYKMSAKPALPTSAVVEPIDISFTEKATHVYVKVEDPGALCPRFEGPYKITSRPSRSTIQVRIGSFVDGSPRHQVYNWQSCKIAHMRPEAQEGSRPKLGRPSKDSSDAMEPSSAPSVVTNQETRTPSDSTPSLDDSHIKSKQQASRPVTSKPSSESVSRSPHPEYLKKGPLITEEMFNKANWPDILQIPSSGRPVRSSRNPNPAYVDFLALPA